MGEIADDIIERMLNLEGWNDDPIRPNLQRTKACKYCGQKGLHWKMTDRGWRLHDEANRIHSCSRPVRASAPNP